MNSLSTKWLSIFILGLGLAIAGQSAAHAQSTAAPIKIGYVDVRGVYDSWSVKTSMDADFEPLKKDLEDKQDELKTAIQNYNKKKSTMAPEKQRKEEAKLTDLNTDFKAKYDEVSQKIEKTAEQMSKQLDTLLNKAFDDLSKKEGYTLILDSRMVRYSTEANMDLTPRLIEYVNKVSATEVPKVSKPDTKDSGNK